MSKLCQGPSCHMYDTSDRKRGPKGNKRNQTRTVGRYAYAKIDQTETSWGYRFPDSDKYFCSQGCKNDWLNTNMESIARRTLPPFIEHRRISEGYEKTTNESRYGYRYTSIQKIGVDNNAD